jgi:hypothetical protein
MSSPLNLWSLTRLDLPMVEPWFEDHETNRSVADQSGPVECSIYQTESVAGEHCFKPLPGLRAFKGRVKPDHEEMQSSVQCCEQWRSRYGCLLGSAPA